MEEGADRRDDQGQDKEGGGEGTTGNGDRLDPLLSSPPWRIELLGGGLRLCHGDRTLTRLETRKAEALVAYLALHKHRSHPRDALARVLWPDEDPEATRPRLRQTLALARRTLEPPPAAPGSVLAADRAEVGVVRRAVATDVEEFEAALREAEKSPPDGDTPGVASWRVAALRRAVNLYKGDLLAGHEAEWIAPERDRLREAFLSALEALAGALAAGGDEEGASRYARRAAAEDPLRESSHALLMRLYAAAGRTAEAVRQYRELERVLRRDLDAEPSEATRLLLRRIQHREGHEEAAPPLPPLPQPGKPQVNHPRPPFRPRPRPLQPRQKWSWRKGRRGPPPPAAALPVGPPSLPYLASSCWRGWWGRESLSTACGGDRRYARQQGRPGRSGSGRRTRLRERRKPCRPECGSYTRRPGGSGTCAPERV